MPTHDNEQIIQLISRFALAQSQHTKAVALNRPHKTTEKATFTAARLLFKALFDETPTEAQLKFINGYTDELEPFN